MRIDRLRLAQISPNPWNPNRMDEAKRKALVKRVRKYGILQPILVRPMSQEYPGDPEATYQVLDGEHRYDALKASGAFDTDCVIVEDVDDWEAKVHTLAMNQIRGRPIPMRLAELLVDIESHLGRDALVDAGFTEPDFAKAEELAGPVADDQRPPEELAEPRRLDVTFMPGQWTEFSAALSAAKAAAETDDDAEALLAMAREFLATYGT